MKAPAQGIHVFIMLYKVVPTFKSSYMYETLVCDYSDESYWEAFSCGTVYSLYFSEINVTICYMNLSV